jgi:hypothetical protein
MTRNKAPELNWAGLPIRPGEGYGGRPENIPEGCPAVIGQGDVLGIDQREAICEADVAAIFSNGAITKTEAVTQLGANTGASRATCYRALAGGGRFAGHLHFEKGKIMWR